MVWLPYLYFLINNYKFIVVTIGLAVIVFAIYPSLVERRRKTFFWKIKSQSNLGFFCKFYLSPVEPKPFAPRSVKSSSLVSTISG